MLSLSGQGDDMQTQEKPQKPRGKVGKPATGPTTIMVRIPAVLKPAVTELVNQYRLSKKKAWEAQPLLLDDDAELLAAAQEVLDRVKRGAEGTISLEEWEQRHGLDRAVD